MIRFHKYIIHFILLVFIQVLIVNNIQINSYINPFIYILFVLILPFDLHKSIILMIGFFTGLTIDIFSDTYGIHAAATTLLAFARPNVLNLISSREAYEPGTSPSINTNGLGWFIKYLLICTFIHHTALFLLESFSFTDFLHTMLKITTNMVSSVFLIVFYYIIALKQSKVNR